MTFLAPMVLAGLGAVAAPIAIHLLNKIRVQTVHWGTMRFLLESLKKNQRRMRIEDLILLLLRILFVALLALAFARPVIHPGAAGAAAASGPTIAVLLLDQSASMGQSDGVQTRFDRARSAARKALDDLGPGSQAALFLVTDRVNQVVARPTANFALLRRTLDITEPSDRTSDLLPGIRLALDSLRLFSGAKKEIILFTDNQATAWAQLDSIKPLLDAQPDVHLRLVPLGGEGEDNLAITALKPESVVPAAGQLFGCLVEVANYGAAPATGVRVTLAMNEEPPADETVIDRIEPGQSRAVRLNIRFAQAGFCTLSAAIPPDRLPVDNQRSIAVQVVDQMRTAVVEGTRPASKQDGDGFFLANALAPVDPSHRGDYYMKAETVPASWIDDADLSRIEMIFLCNVGRLGEGASRKLKAYVEDGGALIIFPGPNVQPDDYNGNPLLAEWMPGALGPVREPGKDGSQLAWQDRGYEHPVTALWNDAQNSTLASVRAGKYFPLLPIPAKAGSDSPHVIVKYSDGSPAVIERPFGKGRVVLFSSTATTQWNNLPIHPDFVPLLQRLAGFVSRREGAGPLVLAPGAVFQQAVDAKWVGREFSVVRPGSKGRPSLGGRVELVNRDAVVRDRDTEIAGAYRVLINGEDRPVAAFAVQMDPQESNLHVIAPERLAGLSEEKSAAPGEPVAHAPVAVRREFWAALLWIAAILALVEMTLAHKFSLAK